MHLTEYYSSYCLSVDGDAGVEAEQGTYSRHRAADRSRVSSQSQLGTNCNPHQGVHC